MKYKFIPTENNLIKAEAFAHTLNNDYIINNQKIKQPKTYIKTLDIIKNLQNEGWHLKGVSEQRAKSSRKVTHNYAQLQHPDFNLKTKDGKIDSIASITIENSCDGKSPLNINLGAFRLVCSNGLISRSTINEVKLHHNVKDYENLPLIINSFNAKSKVLALELEKFKDSKLSPKEISNFAYKAVVAKYGKDLSDIDINSFLRVNRIEDEGDDVWSVFNRLQENLTHDIKDMSLDIELNKELFALAESFI